MERISFEERIVQYCNRLKDWEEKREKRKGTEFNKEENTKIKFVVPLLDILGWRPLEGYSVEFEHHIPKLKGRDAADVALYTDEKSSKPVILIEVKPIQNTIREDSPTKIFEYMIHGKAIFGIATNGKQLLLFDNYRTRHDSAKGCKLVGFNFLSKDFINYSEVLKLLTKEMVSDGILVRFSDYFHKESPFFSWRESRKKGNKDYDEYTLRLEFAKDFLKNKI